VDRVSRHSLRMEANDRTVAKQEDQDVDKAAYPGQRDPVRHDA